MFNADRTGTIGFDEFKYVSSPFFPGKPPSQPSTGRSDTYLSGRISNLWGFLAAWRSLFDRFDEDRSGTISYDEFSKALAGTDFRYRMAIKSPNGR